MKSLVVFTATPEISLDGNSLHSRNSEDLMGVLGFCSPQDQADKAGQEEEAREAYGTENPLRRNDPRAEGARDETRSISRPLHEQMKP